MDKVSATGSYPTMERRKTRTRDDNLNELFALFRTMASQIGALVSKQNDMAQDISELKTQVADINKMMHAFPQDERTGEPMIAWHREQHEGDLEEEKSSKHMWRAFRESAVSRLGELVTTGVIVLLMLGLHDWVKSASVPEIPHISIPKAEK